MRQSEFIRLLALLSPGIMIFNVLEIMKSLGEKLPFQSTWAAFEYGVVLNQTSLSDYIDDNVALSSKNHTVATNDGALCQRDKIIDGSWVPVRVERPPYVPKTMHLRCYPDEAFKGKWYTHRWQPNDSQCAFNEWNKTEFCSLMILGTVLIAGDSLSWEHYSSLGQLLGLRIHQSSQFVSKEKDVNHVQFGCDRRQTRLAFRRDDILSNLGSAIKETFPQVVVINRGAHYQNDTSLIAGIRRNIEELKEWKETCQNLGIKCHLFWRTSVPGHPLCDQNNFTRPNNDLAAMEAWIANQSNYNERTIKYHWDDYQRQNNLVLEMLYQGLGRDGFEVLDAYYLNVLRPDEHRAHQGDCLHNCYPGKMDVYSQLLLHYLKMQRADKDIDDLAHFYDQVRVARQASANATLAPV